MVVMAGPAAAQPPKIRSVVTDYVPETMEIEGLRFGTLSGGLVWVARFIFQAGSFNDTAAQGAERTLNQYASIAKHTLSTSGSINGMG